MPSPLASGDDINPCPTLETPYPPWSLPCPSRSLAVFAALILLTVATHPQNGIKIEKFLHSTWTKGIFL
jgi:hypothetical protein